MVANCSAVRELDANGTNFGYNPRTGNKRGEFGHNDFYPVALAAAQIAGWDGRRTLLAMLCLDEIRGRLAEVFGLKDHKIDHVLHGAIASAAVYGAMLGATAEQIESAIGLVVAHYVPFRAIRHGEQLSDSKGASAAISAEVAVLSMRRAMRGFVGPADIFRNPQAVFCLFEPPHETGDQPVRSGAGSRRRRFRRDGHALQAGPVRAPVGRGDRRADRRCSTSIRSLLADPAAIERIRITIYEPAFSIIGDPHKRDPRTRQSADHSMVYIMATLLRKAIGIGNIARPSWMRPHACAGGLRRRGSVSSADARANGNGSTSGTAGRSTTPNIPMAFPTLLEIEHRTLGKLSSGLVMYPEGHARNTSGNLAQHLLEHKFQQACRTGRAATSMPCCDRLIKLASKSPAEIRELYSFEIDHVRPA